MKYVLSFAATWTVLFSIHSAIPTAQGAPATAARFTPLTPVTQVAIINSTVAYPNGNYDVDNIVDGVADGRRGSEYSSNGKGIGTFIDFDFGRPMRIAAFKHVDRFDPATVDTAKLIFSDVPDFTNVVATITVDHANTRGGATSALFNVPAARYVRWQVTALGPKGHGTVGGSEISFFAAAEAEASPSRVTIEGFAPSAILRKDDKLLRPLELTIGYPYAEPVEATVEVSGLDPMTVGLRLGSHVIRTQVPAAAGGEATVSITLKIAGRPVARRELALGPVRRWEIYLMHHTHLDIGYTHTQEDVEKHQMEFLDQVQELIHSTDDYPPESQFKWLPEGLWAVESYLKQADDNERRALIDAVKADRIGLDALYGNALTGLYNDEELFALLDYAVQLRKQYGIRIDSAMISDVPGYTWGLVPALAHNGIKYLSIGPNNGHRIGRSRVWNDRPFYWVSPSGRHKVLCWMAGKGYSWFHKSRVGRVPFERRLFGYLRELEQQNFPYDMVQLRYTIGGDNGPPDPTLSDTIKAWNEKYAYPKIVICTTSQMFHEFERRYGDRLPVVRGDFTPYWEDGAASTAADTAVNRRATETLIQAQTLWAMLNPGPYPNDRFYAAWRNAVLYDEHTWGAHNSIRQPDSPFAKAQAARKQKFALDADAIARQLLDEVTATRRAENKQVRAVEVLNTCCWPRTDLVVLPADMKLIGDLIKTTGGSVVPSQRLSSGELAFLAENVPPLGSMRFTVEPGEAPNSGRASADGATLTNGLIRIKLNTRTGAIEQLVVTGIDINLAKGHGLNEYIYVKGREPDNQERIGSVKIELLDRGPLVATAQITSEAPGARKLVRQVRLIDGIGRVDLSNVIDKLPVRRKEGVHVGFDFNVPEATVRMDVPWAVMRPEDDQIDGACKNYFTVQRWVDVSNPNYGLTWATVDAPLVQMGAIRTDVHNWRDPNSWLQHIEHSPTLFSYVMNNYWETNYKADQEGPTTFLYSIRPHACGYDQMQATRFGIERNRPLVAIPARLDGLAALKPLLKVEPSGVIVTSLKPSRDGKAWIIRLFAASGRAEQARLTWADPAPKAVYFSSPDQRPGDLVDGPIELPAYGIVTLQAISP